MSKHDRVRYGDIIYIEQLSLINSKKRYVFYSSGYSLNQESYVEPKLITLGKEGIFLKDFENNLFVIFPTMKEDFLNHKQTLDSDLSTLKQNVVSSLDEIATKKEISKVIQTYEEVKKDVDDDNKKFISLIGQPIKFGESFILIHYKSQMFVSKYEPGIR